MAPMKDALSQQFPAMASGDQEVAPKGTDMEEERASKEPQLMSVDPQNLPGYLPWEQDLEMMSKFLDRKEELIESHKKYIKENPELKAILADFFQALLIQRPDDVYEFARKFFTPFNPQAPHAPSYPSYKSPAKSV